MGAKAFDLRAVVSLARVLDRQGPSGEVQELLGPFSLSFTDGFDTKDPKDAQAQRADLE